MQPAAVLRSTLNAIATLSVLLPETAAMAQGERPNIVVLFADDLGYGELGCQGNTEIPTPHIDSIAKHGVRCTSGYVTAPYCSASRAGLLTGRYQTRFGYEFNPVGRYNSDPRVGLPHAETTIAEMLRDAGYATGLVGKWHLGGSDQAHPLRHGFDEFFGFLHEGHYFVPPPYDGVTTMLRRRALPSGKTGRWISRDGRLVLSTHMNQNEPAYDAGNPILRNSQPAGEQEYLTDAFTREAVDFIDRNQERPFFLYVAYSAVHSPLQARQADLETLSHIDDIHRRIFAAMLLRLDHSVGEVLGKLKQESLLQDTLVFFISDNGGPTRELTSSNAPLRGGKGTVYEGGVRVPFLVQWPQVLPAGVEYPHPVISTDVMSTAAHVAQATAPAERDGVNLVPFLTGQRQTAPHDALFWRQGHRTALRLGQWKLVRQNRPQRGQSTWELFDLANDLAEQNNLAAQQPELLAKLMRRWEQMNGEMADPAWTPSR